MFGNVKRKSNHIAGRGVRCVNVIARRVEYFQLPRVVGCADAIARSEVLPKSLGKSSEAVLVECGVSRNDVLEVLLLIAGVCGPTTAQLAAGCRGEIAIAERRVRLFVRWIPRHCVEQHSTPWSEEYLPPYRVHDH